MAFIPAACVFDLFDGRVARMIGADSPFGREFDSLADLISFGARRRFWCIASCPGRVHSIRGDRVVHCVNLSGVRGVPAGPVQLFVHDARRRRGARSSRLSDSFGGGVGDFADAVHDLAQRNRLDGGRFNHSKWRYLLPILMLFLSWMMVSKVKYPSFKVLNLRTTRSFPGMLGAILLLGIPSWFPRARC